jgi:hypothetical protein
MVADMVIHRRYSIERDAQGLPFKLVWRGDVRIPSKEEQDRQRLEEHEQIYGKRTN